MIWTWLGKFACSPLVWMCIHWMQDVLSGPELQWSETKGTITSHQLLQGTFSGYIPVHVDFLDDSSFLWGIDIAAWIPANMFQSLRLIPSQFSRARPQNGRLNAEASRSRRRLRWVWRLGRGKPKGSIFWLVPGRMGWWLMGNMDHCPFFPSKYLLVSMRFIGFMIHHAISQKCTL